MLAKSYSDDEYYTTAKAAEKFFRLVVAPSGILDHKTVLMPFSTNASPLYLEAIKYHDNVVPFMGDRDLWQKTADYEDCAVVDNPPFSMSVAIEKRYFRDDVPFVLFRSAVSYPKFILEHDDAGIISENSKRGIDFSWGLAEHIYGDDYIAATYPNLIANLESAGVLHKFIPTAFSFHRVNYSYKINTVSFSKMIYPHVDDTYIYINRGVYHPSSKIYIGQKDGRVHLISEIDA